MWTVRLQCCYQGNHYWLYKQNNVIAIIWFTSVCKIVKLDKLNIFRFVFDQSQVYLNGVSCFGKATSDNFSLNFLTLNDIYIYFGQFKFPKTHPDGYSKFRQYDWSTFQSQIGQFMWKYLGKNNDTQQIHYKQNNESEGMGKEAIIKSKLS